jgi:hypothetical protein
MVELKDGGVQIVCIVSFVISLVALLFRIAIYVQSAAPPAAMRFSLRIISLPMLFALLALLEAFLGPSVSVALEIPRAIVETAAIYCFLCLFESYVGGDVTAAEMLGKSPPKLFRCIPLYRSLTGCERHVVMHMLVFQVQGQRRVLHFRPSLVAPLPPAATICRVSTALFAQVQIMRPICTTIAVVAHGTQTASLANLFGLASFATAFVTIMSFKLCLQTEDPNFQKLRPMLKFMVFKIWIWAILIQNVVIANRVSNGQMEEHSGDLYRSFLVAIESAVAQLLFIPLFPASEFEGMPPIFAADEGGGGTASRGGRKRQLFRFVLLFNPFVFKTAPPSTASRTYRPFTYLHGEALAKSKGYLIVNLIYVPLLCLLLTLLGLRSFQIEDSVPSYLLGDSEYAKDSAWRKMVVPQDPKVVASVETLSRSGGNVLTADALLEHSARLTKVMESFVQVGERNLTFYDMCHSNSPYLTPCILFTVQYCFGDTSGVYGAVSSCWDPEKRHAIGTASDRPRLRDKDTGKHATDGAVLAAVRTPCPMWDGGVIMPMNLHEVIFDYRFSEGLSSNASEVRARALQDLVILTADAALTKRLMTRDVTIEQSLLELHPGCAERLARMGATTSGDGMHLGPINITTEQAGAAIQAMKERLEAIFTEVSSLSVADSKRRPPA